MGWSLEEDPTGWATYLVDFGAVAIGSEASREISVENRGSSDLVLAARAPGGPFSMEPASGRITIPVGESRPLIFGFAPTEVSDSPHQVIVTVNTNEGQGDGSHTIRLVGEAVNPSLDCSPDPLDFGMVVLGHRKTSTLLCTNTLSAPLSVEIEGFRGNARSAYSAAFVEEEEDALTLEPGDSLEIEVEFRGEHLGVNEATLVLRDPNHQLLAQVGMLGETMSSALQLQPAVCLDFEYVSIDASKRLPLFAHNIGSSELRITELSLTDELGAFEIVSQTPIVLPPGGEPAEILVEFRPPIGGVLSTQVMAVALDEDGEPASASACASGFGGGPSLSCHPGAVDFGQVAVGMPASLEFRCVNDGHAPPGSSVDPLFITEVTSDNPVFVPTVRNPDGSTGVKSRGYEIGESFTVEVRFDPDSDSLDSATIGVHTDAVSGGVLELRASGQGRLLEPCDFSVVPPRLRYGVVDRGKEMELAFTIVNHLESACLIHNLRLTDDSNPAFFTEPISFHELEGLGSLRVPVIFAPTEHAPRLEGAVQFQISNPDRSEQRVELEGSSDEACLDVYPTYADFGVAGVGCTSRETEIRIQNVCRRPVTLVGIELSEQHGSDQFQITGRPVLPRTMQPRDSHTISVTFTPNAIGKVEGALEFEIEGFSFGETFHYLSRIAGEGGSTDAIQTDRFQQGDQPKVDILWVMDNSGSFEPYQERISENLPAFLTYANANMVDWHIAVTTTGLRAQGPSCPGGANGGENGRFFPVDGSYPRILDRRTPGLEEAWKNNIKVGTCHSDEVALEAAKRALSEPLIGSEKDERYPDSGYQDGNAGFLRRDADLSIIFVTDEVEQSPYEPEHYVQFFQGVKAWGNRAVRLHAITGPKESQGWMNCGMVEYGDRLLRAVDLTHGYWLNICTPVDDRQAWAEGLSRMSEGAFGFISRFVLRGLPASRTGDPRVNEKDLEVRINGTLRPPMAGANQVWTYDPVSNAIDFTHFYTPPAGSEITVTYQVRCN